MGRVGHGLKPGMGEFGSTCLGSKPIFLSVLAQSGSDLGHKWLGPSLFWGLGIGRLDPKRFFGLSLAPRFSLVFWLRLN